MIYCVPNKVACRMLDRINHFILNPGSEVSAFSPITTQCKINKQTIMEKGISILFLCSRVFIVFPAFSYKVLFLFYESKMDRMQARIQFRF